jgi:hypothetical protein
LLDNDQVKCWGSNQYGVLGLNPELIASVGKSADGMGDSLNPVQLGNDVDIPVKVSVSSQSSCVQMTNNNVKCWGSGSDGILNGNSMIQVFYLDESTPYMPFSEGEYAKDFLQLQIFMGCAILNTNRVKCWGYNGFEGMLGLGNTDEIYYGGPVSVTATVDLGSVECDAASTSVVCKQCPTPNFYLAGQCTTCPIGGYYVDPQTSCTACAQGTSSIQDPFGQGIFPTDTCLPSPTPPAESPTPSPTQSPTPSPTPPEQSPTPSPTQSPTPSPTPPEQSPTPPQTTPAEELNNGRYQ